MSALLAAPPKVTWPRLTACDRCGEDVLIARGIHQGRPFTLEPREILPEDRCGHCRGCGRVPVILNLTNPQGGKRETMGARAERQMTNPTYVNCYACLGTGRRGEPVPRHYVALNPAGVARKLGPSDERARGEAIHRRHRCAG